MVEPLPVSERPNACCTATTLFAAAAVLQTTGIPVTGSLLVIATGWARSCARTRYFKRVEFWHLGLPGQVTVSPWSILVLISHCTVVPSAVFRKALTSVALHAVGATETLT